MNLNEAIKEEIQISEIHKIEFKGQIITGTYAELEELCLALEEYLYDEPSYAELEEKAITLAFEKEKLEKELEYLRDEVE